jgi:hypothetical protein
MNLIFYFLFYFLNISFAKESQFADLFYPADKKVLSAFIDDNLSKAKNYLDNKDEVLAVISPHAGYIYSGRIASISYKNTGDNYDLIIIIGTAHNLSLDRAAVLYDDYYETPLGKEYIDKKFIDLITKKKDLFEKNNDAFYKEHSIETQLPFIQRKFGDKIKIVPIILNNSDLDKISKMGEELAYNLKGRKPLFIISTDLSHYPKLDDAEIYDNAVLKSLELMNENYFYIAEKYILSQNIPNLYTCACGDSALMLGMSASRKLGAVSFKLFEYSNSYRENMEITDKNKVVGYASGAFLKGKKKNSLNFNISKKDSMEILDLAKKSIENGFEHKIIYKATNPLLNLPAGVFTTLTIDNKLRGCIGFIEPIMSIGEAITRSAYSAAFEDYRFNPLKKEELNKIKIEVSILSPLKEIKDISEVSQNRHGVVIRNKEKSGVFLPDVWEYFKNKEDFLNELCTQKASMDKKCWENKESKIYVFETLKIKEGEL